MENELAEYIVRVCDVLNRRAVEYMIVGGVAVALHGYFRKSVGPDGKLTDKPDMDIWYNPTYDNYFKLLDALEELGQEVSKYKNEQTPNPKKSFFRYDLKDFTLDFLPSLSAKIFFHRAFNKRELVSFNNIDIPFIGYDDLINDKKVNGRLKDLEDIEYLKHKSGDAGKN